jgi:hypothetical protein
MLNNITAVSVKNEELDGNAHSKAMLLKLTGHLCGDAQSKEQFMALVRATRYRLAMLKQGRMCV